MAGVQLCPFCWLICVLLKYLREIWSLHLFCFYIWKRLLSGYHITSKKVVNSSPKSFFFTPLMSTEAFGFISFSFIYAVFLISAFTWINTEALATQTRHGWLMCTWIKITAGKARSFYTDSKTTATSWDCTIPGNNAYFRGKKKNRKQRWLLD